MIRPSLLAAAVLGVLLSAASASAQTRFSGTVLDDQTGQPIAGARVEILDWGARKLAERVTDANGAFEYTFSRPNTFRVRVTRLGYARVVTPEISTGRNSYLNVQVRMKSDTVLLAPLAVVARGQAPASPLLDGFYARAGAGFGTYYTREDIERIRPTRLSDLVLRTPGFFISGTNAGRHLYSSRTGGVYRDCPAQIYIDGFLLNPRGQRGEVIGSTLDDSVLPQDVEGIEIYRGLSTVPAEFLNLDAKCAVVAVWTRRGGTRS
jgi:hypothetical protein